jgi:hypothetical protein
MRRHERGHGCRLASELTRMPRSSHRAMHVQPARAVTGTIATDAIPVTDASPGPRRNPGSGEKCAHLARYSVRVARCVTP